MDTKANIRPLICDFHLNSFDNYSFSDDNNIGHSDIIDWSESDPNIDSKDTCGWYFIKVRGMKYLSHNLKSDLLSFFQEKADENNIPFHSSMLTEYSDNEIQSMVIALLTTLKDRDIDIKQDYLDRFRSLL